MLIDERVAKIKLMGTKRGQDMKPEERAEYLKPFTLTSILKEEMMNLREENEGVNIILKQANKGIKKDKFSAFEYGLYYIKQEEDKKRKRTKKRFSDMLFMNWGVKMRASRGEIKIEEILRENEMRFTEEQIFEGLNSPNGRPLKFDFCVFDDDWNVDFLIEY